MDKQPTTCQHKVCLLHSGLETRVQIHKDSLDKINRKLTVMNTLLLANLCSIITYLVIK